MVAVTSVTATSNGSRVLSLTFWMPLTLRTYCRAAASISSDVADGSSPRSSVMFRHMQPTIPGADGELWSPSPAPVDFDSPGGEPHLPALQGTLSSGAVGMDS